MKQHYIGDYLISSTIGHGSSGRVKLGIHQITRQKVAIKIIPRSQLNNSMKATHAVERELAVLQLLHHPNLIDLYQVLQDEDNVYFVTEYVSGGELFYHINEKGKLSEIEAKNIFMQIASALSWCHVRNICHRDLKPENILLDKQGKNIKIADFGMATMQSSDALLKTSCGSPHYVSPEIIRGIPYYGPSADVWSAGVILYTMLTGSLPFDDNHVGRLLGKIKSGRFKKIPDWVSSLAKDLIYRILVIDPNQRISFNDILSHPWMISSLSTTTKATTMISIHSISLQSSPWYDDKLNHPLILNSGDLHGPTKETLKVLWRDLTNDQIVSFLMEKNPNLQKLTYQLLQQRLSRTLDSIERSTDSIGKNSNYSSDAVTILPAEESCSSSSTENLITACDDDSLGLFDIQINNLSSRRESVFKYTRYSSSGIQPPCPQSQSNKRHSRNNSNALINQKVLYPPSKNSRRLVSLCSPQQVRSKRLPTTHETLLSTLSIILEEKYRLKNQLLLLLSGGNSHNKKLINSASTSTRIKKYIKHTYNSFISALFTSKKPKKKPTKVIRQEFAIKCMAKSEFIAAGKLHYILSDHFQGKLNGCMYPDGKILWSGEIDKTTFAIDQQRLHNIKACFLCKVRIVSDKKSLYKLVFIIHREDPILVSTFANRLNELLTLYEKESEYVTKSNRWKL